jgi:hypothetical protein
MFFSPQRLADLVLAFPVRTPAAEPLLEKVDASEGGSGYSDPAALPGDDAILCFYGRGKKLIIAPANLDWLTDGQDSFPSAQP